MTNDKLEKAIDRLEGDILEANEVYQRYKAFTRLSLRVADEIAFDQEGGVHARDDAVELFAEFVDQAAGIELEEQTDPPRKREFEKLKQKWKEETGHISGLKESFMNEHYQRIIGMGRAALPLIFQDMLGDAEEREAEDDYAVSGHWHWALNAITGHNPVPDEHAGDMRAIKEDWLQYAREMGFIDQDA